MVGAQILITFGKYGIHPSFVQEMLGDSRYTEVDLMSVIDYLRKKGGKKFAANTY